MNFEKNYSMPRDILALNKIEMSIPSGSDIIIGQCFFNNMCTI